MEVWKEQSLKIAQNNIWKTFFSWYIKASTIPRIHDDTCRIPLRIFSGDSSKLAKYIGGEVWPHSELSKPADLSDLWSLRHVSRNSRSSSTGPGPSKPKKRGTETFYQEKSFIRANFRFFFQIPISENSFPFAFQEVSYALSIFFREKIPQFLPYTLEDERLVHLQPSPIKIKEKTSEPSTSRELWFQPLTFQGCSRLALFLILPIARAPMEKYPPVEISSWDPPGFSREGDRLKTGKDKAWLL